MLRPGDSDGAAGGFTSRVGPGKRDDGKGYDFNKKAPTHDRDIGSELAQQSNDTDQNTLQQHNSLTDSSPDKSDDSKYEKYKQDYRGSAPAYVDMGGPNTDSQQSPFAESNRVNRALEGKDQDKDSIMNLNSGLSGEYPKIKKRLGHKNLMYEFKNKIS